MGRQMELQTDQLMEAQKESVMELRMDQKS
jgi:hypothetical protein